MSVWACGFDSRQPHQKERHDLWSCLSFCLPATEGGLHPSVFQCSGQINCPCAKVFTCGENACTAQTRRPTVWGPGPVCIFIINTRYVGANDMVFAPTCAKVFTCGENACTAQTRRPTVWGPGPVCIFIINTRYVGANDMVFAPTFFVFPNEGRSPAPQILASKMFPKIGQIGATT